MTVPDEDQKKPQKSPKPDRSGSELWEALRFAEGMLLRILIGVLILMLIPVVLLLALSAICSFPTIGH
ncbi:MAG: hypothetical protein KDA58_13805 [Planctomycetaceae bacterium]|nr:hypothetical protein [Planctomycetaceae bacterium]